MSYNPAWNATFAKPLVNQAIALIQRDQAAAISIVNQALQPISEFHKGPSMRTAFPWLLLAVNGLAFDRAQPLTRHAEAHLSFMLETGQFDQEFAQDLAQDYAQMLDMILTTATGNDWMTALPIVHETVPAGTTTPPESASVKDVFIESHKYDLITLPEIDAPVMRVTLDVLFELEET